MTAPEDGVEQLDVRTCWEHEALDFTPWLAKQENLDLLGAELGLSLECAQTEVQVGSMYLDILAKERDTGVLVAIENQLEETDLGHLGQLLTYASGLDARVAIWVAPAFYHEYAQALHKLNQWTADDVRFYGVKVEVVRKPGGEPEARFRTVVYPGEWHLDRTLAPGAKSAVWQQHDDFFRPLIAELRRARFADSATQYFDYTGRVLPSGFDDGIGYAVSFWKTGAWVTLYIETEDKALTKRVFDALMENRAEIESRIAVAPGDEWHWLRHNPHLFCSISVRKDGTIDDPPEELERTRAWMLDLLPRFRDVFDPRVKEILGEASPARDAGSAGL